MSKPTPAPQADQSAPQPAVSPSVAAAAADWGKTPQERFADTRQDSQAYKDRQFPGPDRVYKQLTDLPAEPAAKEKKALAGDVISPLDPLARARACAADSTEKVTIGGREATEQEWVNALAASAETAANAAARPTKPDQYTLTLPEDFVVPDGLKWEFNEADPMITHAREFALDHGLDQKTFSKILGLYAGIETERAVSIHAAQDAERKKLGSAGPARVTAIETWLGVTLGKELGRSLTQMMWTERSVVAFEKLQQAISSQGAASFTQAGRDNSAPTLSPEEYDRMTYAEKRQYAENAQAGKR